MPTDDAAADESGPAGADAVLYTAGAVLTSPDGEPIPAGAVLVRGDRVAAIGRRAEFGEASDVRTVDLGPGVLVPGFIDAHVHLGFDGSESPSAVMRSGDDVELAWLLSRNASRQLHSGVTTCRDLGCRGCFASNLRDAIADGRVVGPRVFAADRPVTVTGGHCWYMSEECDDTVELLKAVRRRHRDGADVVKIMLTGGFLYLQGETPHRPVYSVDDLTWAVEEAHRLDLRVAVHAHGVPGVKAALEAGVDTIEHATMTTSRGVEFDPELADAMAAAEVVVVPTLNARWTDDDLPWASAETAFGVLAGLHAAGVRLAIGTDAGIDGVPHGRYVDAVLALSAAGLSTRDVYRAVTSSGAAAVGSDDVGAITIGGYADFVLLGCDPRDDLTAIGAPQHVIARGRVVDPHDSIH